MRDNSRHISREQKKTMRFTDLVHTLHKHSSPYKNKLRGFGYDLIFKSGGTYLGDCSYDELDSSLRESVNNSMAQLLKTGAKARLFEGRYTEGKFDRDGFLSFLNACLPQSDVQQLATDLGIVANGPDRSAILDAISEYMRLLFKYGEGGMPEDVSLDSLYKRVFSNPDAFNAKKATFDELSLIIEADNRCPICQGQKQDLYDEKQDGRGSVFRCYRIVDIFSHDDYAGEGNCSELLADLDWIPEEGTTENRIALCVNHALRYEAMHDTDTCERLYNAKLQFHLKDIGDQVEDANSLGEEIHGLIDILVSKDFDSESAKLFAGVLKIDDKLSECPNIVKGRVANDVKLYFNDIHDYLSGWERQPTSGQQQRATLLATRIKAVSLDLMSKGLTQEKVVRGVADFIDRKTDHRSPEAAFAIASFFVQNCEVLTE